MNVFNSNLNRLREISPSLAENLATLESSSEYSIDSSKGGCPTLKWNSASGRSLFLHSRYNPAQEAERFIDTLDVKGASNFIVFGLGLGYHLIELIKKAPSHSKFFIVESRPEILKLALEGDHFSQVLNTPHIRWLVGRNVGNLNEALSDWRDDFTLNGFTPVYNQSLTQVDPDFYAEQELQLTNTISTSQVEHNTRRVLSKFLCQNCFKNFKQARMSPGIEVLKSTLQGEAVMVIAAGPSLDKNIPLIRGAQERCHILAVSTALKPLREAGIEPDFVVAIDPKPVSATAFDDPGSLKKTRLIFHPCIPENVTNLFPKCSFSVDAELYLWKFLTRGFQPKGQLGNNTSVAHTAFNLALHLGCDPVILVGQDLSFQSDRSHCSGAYHGESLQQNIGTNQTARGLNHRKRRGTTSAVQISHDIFGNAITTSQALDSFRFPFEKIKQTGTRVINATEGGVSLSGIENSTLKEILSELPLETEQNIPGIKSPEMNLDSPLESMVEFTSRIEEQSVKFKTFTKMIQNWLAENAPATSETDSELKTTRNTLSSQVRAGETLLNDIIKDNDTVQLLQEFLYSEFLDWNRETYQIALMKKDEGQLEKKLQRNVALFSAMEKAMQWFSTEFNNLRKTT